MQYGASTSEDLRLHVAGQNTYSAGEAALVTATGTQRQDHVERNRSHWWGREPQILVKTKHATKSTKRRLLGAASFLLSIVTASFVVTGVTSARFSANKPGSTNTFHTGTVTLSNSPTTACTISNILPDGTSHPCPTFTATYNGSVSAYLAVDVLIETQAGSGGSKLYTGGANDLQVTVSSTSPSVTYSVPTVATTCPGSAPALSTCYELHNELVATTALASAAVVFTTTVSLPTTSGTGDQGGLAQILLTTHAVQSGNNTVACASTPPSSISPPTAGKPCTATSSFKWS
jgi:hypothetical protein